MRNYQKKFRRVFAISSFDVAFVPRFVFKWVKLGDFDLPDIFRINTFTLMAQKLKIRLAVRIFRAATMKRSVSLMAHLFSLLNPRLLI